jgi:hypothetical protein
MKSAYTAGKTVLASSVFLGMAFGAAHAEICYKTPPFIDIIRVAETQFTDEAPNGTHTLVVGNWTAGSAYSLPVVGSKDTSINPGGIRFAIHADQHTTFFGNHSDCTLDATVGGAGSTSCDGRVPGFFNVAGWTLVPVSCDSVGASAPAAVGKTMGQ